MATLQESLLRTIIMAIRRTKMKQPSTPIWVEVFADELERALDESLERSR